jgi:HipA-like protein
MLRTVYATRYVIPLREGGSLPAIVEADDLGLYVLKFRGAGQGPLALVAELIAGEIGRALGLKVPELVRVEVDVALGRNEEDPEIRDLLKASVGLNLGLDYLPGSVSFDPAARDVVAADLASAIVWFDAFVTNVDRTPRNANLLWWHKVLYLIDHGAALYFHHNWQDVETAARSRFPAVRDHVLLPWASHLEAADGRLRPRLNETLFAEIVEQIPDDWLAPEPLDRTAPSPSERRAGYVDFLTRRLAASSVFVEEAVRARAQLL